MKKQLLKTCTLAAFALLFNACSPDEEVMSDFRKLEKSSTDELATGCERITFDNFTRSQDGFVSHVTSDQNSGPIVVSAFRRTAANTYSTANVANIFDSNRTGVKNQVDDILTPHTDFGGGGIGDGGGSGSPYANDTRLGNLMIINRSDNSNEAYDFNRGGKMVFDFSALGTVTLNAVTVMDVDSYEEGGKVALYGPESVLLKEVMLQVSGSNGKQVVDLGNTAGVERMEIILGPGGISTNGGFSGSGAIDNIEFCREKQVYGCTLTQGYWKNHAEGRKYDATWGNLPSTTFYGSGMTYLKLMNTAPKGGNAYVILAHQYIAAVLNMKKASSTAEVDRAVAQATAYFDARSNGRYANTISSPYTTASREDLIRWAGILASYNEGKIGPGHCD